MTRLTTFIRENSQAIISEWEDFARTLVPAADTMSPLSLRNHIVDILKFIADDIESYQSATEQVEKSHGEKPKPSLDSVAEIHAALRQAGGFDLDQMVSEYRALRASVIKLWGAQSPDNIPQHIGDLIRFNEAIDQTMTESISYYSKKVERSRSLFLGILGHDLRNPLGAMVMAAQLVVKIGALSQRQAMLIDQIVLSGDRAIEILQHLLDLTRARLGRGMGVIREPMDMAFVARQMVDEARTGHPTRTFSLVVSGDTQGAWDKARIGQLFSNLVGNALQYGFKDTPIDIAIAGTEDDVTISIHNEGIPIAPDAIQSVFESLIRGETADSIHPSSVNLGLGLYITKEIVLAHHGTIDVRSTEKDGTTFVAHFPRAPADVTAVTASGVVT